MTPLNGLTIAVPRGALFSDTVAICSPSSGSTPRSSATNDRKLLFEDVGVITMRPSDVPTYVEAGSADLGVTGKDVLLEQTAQEPGESGRQVYELLDLGYGRCTMVLAGKAGEDTAMESLRRLGVMRVATKYPRVAARHMEATGRQAEIVEVKGSVELAPLTGPGRGDRRPHRHRHHPAREQPRDPRGAVHLHRPADRQPRLPQAQGGGRGRPPRPACASSRAPPPPIRSRGRRLRCACSASTPRPSPSSAPRP